MGQPELPSSFLSSAAPKLFCDVIINSQKTPSGATRSVIMRSPNDDDEQSEQ